MLGVPAGPQKKKVSAVEAFQVGAAVFGRRGAGLLAEETDLYALSDEERSAFRNRHIGVIPQGRTALRSLTVLENVLLPSRLYVQKSENVLEYRDRALALLEKLSIGHLKDAWPNELSGGELRRLSIARALIMSPDILLADEPTGDLDDENTGSVLKLLREKADGGTAVLLVTHEQSAAAYADRVLTMQEGRLSGG